jgi:hypothetical protein
MLPIANCRDSGHYLTRDFDDIECCVSCLTEYSEAVNNATPEQVKNALEIVERLHNLDEAELLGCSLDWQTKQKKWEVLAWYSWDLHSVAEGSTLLEALRIAQQKKES